MSQNSKLVRSKSDAAIGGVCAGLAKNLHADVVLIRLIFVALGLIQGVGVWIYLAMWLLLPAEGEEDTPSQDVLHENATEIAGQIRSRVGSLRESTDAAVLVGVGLVAMGAIFLLSELLPWFSLAMLWPIVLISIGAYLLLRKS